MRTLEDFNGKYQGETCFIIGAGTSIHFQNLKPLEDRLTFAVNSGYVAAPWADFFVSDDWSVARWSYFFEDLAASSHTIPLLYETKLASQLPLFGLRGVLFRHRKGISIPDRYEHSNRKYHIGETRTSVGSAIMIAHVMGCSKIVLLGIDGCRQFGKRYFWQLDKIQTPYPKEYKLPSRSDRIPIDAHSSTKCAVKGKQMDHDLIDINCSWQPFATAVNKKCKVYNVSEVSIIKAFPTADLNEFIDS